MKPAASGMMRVRVYPLVANGLGAPIRFGINRALKHGDTALSNEEIDRIVDCCENELLNWFCDTFSFDEE